MCSIFQQMFSIIVVFFLLLLYGNCENCTLLKDKFGTAASDFTLCAIQNARPIHLCENCVQQYITLTEDYNLMKKFADNSTLCIDEYINLDRLQIVKTLYAHSFNLWDDAKCYRCFDVINGTLTPNRSQEAIKFDNYFNDFKQCLNRSDVNETTLCPMCMDNYVALDTYYHSISNENEKIGVCMDMVDLMNGTRLYWSEKCCKYRKHSEHIFIVSTLSVLILTISFYVITLISSVKKTPTILPRMKSMFFFNDYSNVLERRFAESFSQSNHH